MIIHLSIHAVYKMIHSLEDGLCMHIYNDIFQMAPYYAQINPDIFDLSPSTCLCIRNNNYGT